MKHSPQSFAKKLFDLLKKRRLHDAAVRGAFNGVQKCLPILRQHVIDKGAVATGDLNRGWRTGITARGAYIRNVCPHAFYVETGRKPGGKMPPVSAILRWVMLKTNRGGQGAERMAWAVARSIAENGIKGRHFLKTLEKQFKRIVGQEILSEVKKELRR